MSKGLNGVHHQKAEELSKTVDALSFRLRRTLKNVRWCRESCKSTSKMIGEINGRIQRNEQPDVRKTG
jgi:hypothetical protein